MNLFHALTFFLALIASVDFKAYGQSTTPHQEIVLTGTAAGGVVSLTHILQLSPRYTSIQTTQGQSAQLVVKQLANEINKSDPFGWRGVGKHKITYSGPGPQAKVDGNMLILPGAMQCAFSGTDKGFVTLKPVLSVSGYYDSEKNQVVLHWINPEESYDTIQASGRTLPPGTTSCAFDWKGQRTNYIFGGWLGVVVKRSGMISPPASINLWANAQEELDTFPYYMGVAPNWSGWSDSDNPGAVKLEQGIKSEVPTKGYVEGYIEWPEQKPLFQIIKTTRKDVQGGVWRRFLGLKPGHTYEVEVRLNTLEMDACTNAWAFSFHAAYDNPDGAGLTTNQMAGVKALFDGSKGPAAGRVALYGPGATTEGQWKKRSTDVSGPGLEIKNITLPDKVTSITVWLRHSGADSTGVGMDWISVKDVTAMQPAKSEQQSSQNVGATNLAIKPDTEKPKN